MVRSDWSSDVCSSDLRCCPRLSLYEPVLMESGQPGSKHRAGRPRDIYKIIKWLGKSLWVYSIKMQYENVFKGDRCCSCYTCLPHTAPTATQTGRKTAAPGTGTGAPPVAQCLLTNTCPETRQQYKHTCKQRLTLRNSITIHKNSKQN